MYTPVGGIEKILKLFHAEIPLCWAYSQAGSYIAANTISLQ